MLTLLELRHIRHFYVGAFILIFYYSNMEAVFHEQSTPLISIFHLLKLIVNVKNSFISDCPEA